MAKPTMLAQIRRAEDALDRVNPRAHSGLDDLYGLGGALEMMIGYLADAVRLGIHDSVEGLADEPVYDDTETDEFFRANNGGRSFDPHQRISAALDFLDEVHRYLVHAREHAARYHSTIGHIGIRLDPADGEESSDE